MSPPPAVVADGDDDDDDGDGDDGARTVDAAADGDGDTTDDDGAAGDATRPASAVATSFRAETGASLESAGCAIGPGETRAGGSTEPQARAASAKSPGVERSKLAVAFVVIDHRSVRVA